MGEWGRRRNGELAHSPIPRFLLSSLRLCVSAFIPGGGSTENFLRTVADPRVVSPLWLKSKPKLTRAR